MTPVPPTQGPICFLGVWVNVQSHLSPLCQALGFSALPWPFTALFPQELQWKVFFIVPFVPAGGVEAGILQPLDSPRVRSVSAFYKWNFILTKDEMRENDVIIPSLPFASLSPHSFFFLFALLHFTFQLPLSFSLQPSPYLLPYPFFLFVSRHLLLSFLILFLKPFILILAQMVVS